VKARNGHFGLPESVNLTRKGCEHLDIVLLLVVVVLLLGVIFVNGWTDAPNAIATAVSTRVMTPSTAVKMAVVLNFLGTLIMCIISTSVAETVSGMVKIASYPANDQLVMLAASSFAIVIWATAAWYFGIPTSESHALIAGVTGGAIALYKFDKGVNLGEIGNALKTINGSAWSKILIGLVVSSLLCFIVGYYITKLIEVIFRRVRRTTTNRIFNAGEAIAAGAMAFMHGAQDGQKFMAIILLALSISPLTSTWITGTNGSYDIPLWLIVICSLTMSIGTSVGGYKIIKAVGMDMVKLEKYQGFAADMSSSVILFICSSIGLPVSTTNTKTTAIMGVGASKRMSNVNWGVAKEMIMAWVLTFPGCGLIAYFMTKLFLLIF